MPALELRVDQLLLDSQIPRIGAAGGQRDALQKRLAPIVHDGYWV